MTPKGKAYELRDRFHTIHFMSLEMAKESALIAVDEIINSNYPEIYIQGETNIDGFITYYQEVKQEIQKL